MNDRRRFHRRQFIAMLNDAETPPEVIAEAWESETELKELVLLLQRHQPLHVSIVVDEAREQRARRHSLRTVPVRVDGRLPKETLMRCSNCYNGELREERRHKSAEKDGRIAVVTDVPVTVCPSCETVWYDENVAIALDEMLTEMLEHDTMAVRPFSTQASSAA